MSLTMTRTGAFTGGVSTRPVDTLLSRRARDFLTAGPSEAIPLIEYICQLPGAPRIVAEHMAEALLAGHPDFARNGDGRWILSMQLPTSQRPPSSGWTRELLAYLPYVVVDVETTGTRPWAGDRITEIAVVSVREGRIDCVYETLVNPERSIPPRITALTNISWEMVKDAPRFRDVCDEVLSTLDGRIFVGHNAEFDWRFLSAEVERATGRTLEGRRLCTVRMARRLLPQLPSRRLDSVATYYDVEITARHRAGGDATATALILMRLLEDARSRECVCWEDLQILLARRTRRSRRRRRAAMPHWMDRDTTA